MGFETENKNSPAFSCAAISGDGSWYQEGLSKREYFAAKAMQGLLASFTVKASMGNWNSEIEEVAKTSLALADELLKQIG